MNYYIQGNKEKADQIKSAFEKLGYDVTGFDVCNDNILFFTYKLQTGGQVLSTTNANLYTADIIKTHPGYKELELQAKPMFKVGDWIVGNEGIFKITQYEDEHGYDLTDTTGCVVHFVSPDYVESNFHLWSIADAKDGDVLATDGFICIFKKLDKDGYYIFSPCIYTIKDGLEIISDENDTIGSCSFKPATKEDRKLLFRKIKEKCYQWDDEKKELKKIPPHYNISNFHAGMPVLVRDSDNDEWTYTYFSHITDSGDFNTGGWTWRQCIPFNEETKHLLGTTDMCDEMYINW